MKKKLGVVLVLMLIMVTAFGSMGVYAESEDDEYIEDGEYLEDRMFIEFYMSLHDCEINAITTEFDADYSVRYYCSTERPDFLTKDIIKYELTDENGKLLVPNDDGTWTLGKGNYKLRWSNVDEVKERLKEWEFYDQCDFYFPEEEELTVNIYVNGKKTELSFDLVSTTLTVDKESDYVFDPSTLWNMQLTGIMSNADYYQLPEFLRTDLKYTFDVKVKRGAVLTEEELAAPMEEGSYIITWNNVDEIKKLVEESNAEIFDRYTVVFPEEPLKAKFNLRFNGSSRPTEYLDMYSCYGVEQGVALPSAERILSATDMSRLQIAKTEWISNVQIEYYDMDGRKLEESEINGNLEPGEYIARWVNFDEFLLMDIENGWGLQEKYKICDNLDEGYPECTLEVYEPFEYDMGSVLGNGALTVVFGCTTLICLAAIAILASKLKKENGDK